MSTESAVGDKLVEELTKELPRHIDEMIDEAEIQRGVDRARLSKETLSEDILRKSDQLLEVTAPEISQLQDARRRLATHEGDRPTATYFPSVTPGSVLRGYVGLVFLVSALVADARVQAVVWNPAARAGGLLFAAGAAVGVAVVSAGLVLLASLLVENGLDGDSADAGERSRLALAILIGNAFGVLVWRLWGVTDHAVGTGWAVLIWSVGGVIALISMIVSASDYFDMNYTSGQGGLLLRGVAVSVVLVGSAAALIWWQPPLVASAAVVPPYLAFVLYQSVKAARDASTLQRKREEERSTARRPSMHFGNWYSERTRLRSAASEALTAWEQAMRDRAILPLLRQRINEILVPIYSVTLDVLDAPGLRQMRSRDYIVTTRIFDRFRRQLRQIDGGAIGVAGPRGSGKSTLLEAFEEGMFLEPGKRRHLAFTESVPVKYDAREFVLHLHARLCESVIEFASPGRLPVWRRLPYRSRVARRSLRILVYLACWAVVAIVGSDVVRGKQHLGALVAQFWWPLLISLGVLGLTLVVRRRRPGPPPQQNLSPWNLVELHELASQQLFDVRFQQRFTTGWSGKLSLPFGSESSAMHSREVSRAARSYPEVVHDFRGLLSATLAVLDTVPDMPSIRVVVIIDELDKIDSSESARNFVNELKAVFSVDRSGYLFLVSVSEEALASFDRGLPVRDAFDSAFDEISRVEYLRLSDTYSLLRSRVIGLGEPFLCLGHCLAGGLPREIIRVTRDIVDKIDIQHPPTLGVVTAALVAEDLRDKISGLRAFAGRMVSCEPYVSDLMWHLESVADDDITAAKLMIKVTTPPIKALTDEQGANDLVTMQLSSLGYLYYGATLLEVFADGLTETQLARGRDGRGEGSFDTLASVRQLFGINARLAWLTLSAFRTTWGLESVAPPDDQTR
jgi:hypothetical protein